MSFGRHGFCNTADVNTHSIAPSYFEPTWCFRFFNQDNGFSCGTKVKMNNNLSEKMKRILTSFFIGNNNICFFGNINNQKMSLKLRIIKSNTSLVGFEPELNPTRLFNPGYVVIYIFSTLITQNFIRFKNLIFLQISLMNELTEL